MNYEFASDNTAPAAPEILAAVVDANQGHAFSYGADPWTTRLRDVARAAFDALVEIVPILSGKLANHLSLLSITEPGGLIFCHELAHILIDENDGPAHLTACRLIGLPGADGRIAPESLREAIAANAPLPPGSAFSITNATESGTVYTLDEMRALTAIAHEAGLLVHLDGARISNAAARLGCDLADLTTRSNIDILSLGATKNGGLAAEGVVAFGQEIAQRLAAKQLLHGHTPSKMRFLSAQLIAWFDNDGWLTRARHANTQAQRLAGELARIPGVRFYLPIEANLIFVELTTDVRRRLQASEFFAYDLPWFGENVFRFVTCWSTTDESIERLINTLSPG
jgi:threonine aldolase